MAKREGAGVRGPTVDPPRGVFLDQPWRMHPDICAFTTEQFYEGRLRPQPELRRQTVAGPGPLGSTSPPRGHAPSAPWATAFFDRRAGRPGADGWRTHEAAPWLAGPPGEGRHPRRVPRRAPRPPKTERRRAPRRRWPPRRRFRARSRRGRGRSRRRTWAARPRRVRRRRPRGRGSPPTGSPLAERGRRPVRRTPTPCLSAS